MQPLSKLNRLNKQSLKKTILEAKNTQEYRKLKFNFSFYSILLFGWQKLLSFSPYIIWVHECVKLHFILDKPYAYLYIPYVILYYIITYILIILHKSTYVHISHIHPYFKQSPSHL